MWWLGDDVAGSSGASDSSGLPWDSGPSVTVRGSYGTKLEAVVRRVLEVLRREAGAKASPLT
eukprot:scaffold610270_cov33-Prasinocladus_malaysianus.AAC.1